MRKGNTVQSINFSIPNTHAAKDIFENSTSLIDDLPRESIDILYSTTRERESIPRNPRDYTHTHTLDNRRLKFVNPGENSAISGSFGVPAIFHSTEHIIHYYPFAHSTLPRVYANVYTAAAAGGTERERERIPASTSQCKTRLSSTRR